MKHLKTAICLMLAAILLFATACGGRNGNDNGNDDSGRTGGSDAVGTARNDGTTTTGRYVEQDITPPINGRFINLVSHDGTLAAFDEGLRTRFDSTDNGETWAPTPGPGSNTNRFEGVQTAAFLPDGRLLVYLQGEGMAAVSPDGTSEHFPIYEIDNAITEGEAISVTMIQVLSDDQVLLTYSIGGFAGFMGQGGVFTAPTASTNDAGSDDVELMEFDFTDFDISDFDFGELDIDPEELQELLERLGSGDDSGDSEESASTQTHRGMQVVQSTEVRASGQASVGDRINSGGTTFDIGSAFGATTAIHDITTGVRVSELMVPTPLGANSYGDVFMMQGHGLVRHSANGDVDTLLDGTAFAFGAPTGTAVAINSLSDGSHIVNVLTFDGEGLTNHLFRYSWDPNAPVNPDKTITIWSLEDNNLVRAAITEIWRLHPDACITYEIALAGDTAMSAADAIRTLNTRLLSGRGPDILILDGTPIESYAGRGMLLDLTGRVDVSGIYENLLAPYTPNGQMYVIPTQFSIPALLGSEQTLREIETLAALVERVLNGNPPPTTGLEGRMLGGVPEEERSELAFNDLQELFDLMWYANSSAFIYDNRLNSEVLKEFLGAIEAISNMYGLAAGNEMMMGTMNVVAFGSAGGGGRISMIPGSMSQLMAQTANFAAFPISNLTFLQMFTHIVDAKLSAFPGLTQGAWVPSTIVGVSADTNVSDFAMEFINTMLSLPVQMINHFEGLPITREGIETQVNMINERMEEFDMGTFNFDIDALVSQLSTPTIIETTLREMIWATVERLGTGRIDLEGAVQEVEQNIRNYLAERAQ